MSFKREIDTYILLCINQITDENLLNSTGNSTEHLCDKEGMDEYAELIYFALQQKGTQHYKATKLQIKEKRKG